MIEQKHIDAVFDAAGRLVDATTRAKNKSKGKTQYTIDVLAKRDRNPAANQALADLAMVIAETRGTESL